MSGNVPMSNPELMLACHQPFGLARGACIVLSSGRVLACSGAAMGYSDDGGITWCEFYEGRHADGSLPKPINMVELADGARVVHLDGGPYDNAKSTLYDHIPRFINDLY